MQLFSKAAEHIQAHDSSYLVNEVQCDKVCSCSVIPFLLYVQLFISYSKDDKVINIESCTQSPDNLVIKTKVDFEKIFLFVTVTLPVILIYVGLKQ